jgi:hypothetical protein
MESEEDKIEKHETNVKPECCELDFRPSIIIKESPSFLGAQPKDPKIRIASEEEEKIKTSITSSHSSQFHSIAICR